MTDETQNTDSQLPDELTLLRERATKLGIPFHHKAGVEKLKNLINIKLNPDTEPLDEEFEAEDVKVNAAGPVRKPTQEEINALQAPQTLAQINAKMRKDALRLVRIRVSCMNPNKKEHEGEIFTCGNSVIGTVKKYVPFNNDAGWHVPHIIYQMMQERQCQIFYTVKGPNGMKVRKGKLIKEFAIEVLDDLNPTQLKALAEQQAVAHTID